VGSRYLMDYMKHGPFSLCPEAQSRNRDANMRAKVAFQGLINRSRSVGSKRTAKASGLESERKWPC
jgi:hypothetical protein